MELQNFAAKVFDNDLIVDRVGVTYAIEIKFRSRYPDLAAEVANAVADAYIDLQRIVPIRLTPTPTTSRFRGPSTAFP